jgi:general secretion pathway protein K
MRKSQRGVAIVLAMGVVALAAIAAAAIMVTQLAWSRQHELETDHAQSRALIDGALDWSRAVLAEDQRTSAIDHRGEAWALRLAPMPVDNGEIAGSIEDLQGLFNLNNLVRDGKVSLAHLVHFRRLLAVLALPAALGDALADWLDADSEPQPRNGAEDRYYLALESPYLAANRPLADLSELHLVRGFDDGVRARLRPYVTALPVVTSVNVNTAPAEVLAAIIEGLDVPQAEALVAQRDKVYFRGIDEFTRALPRGLSARGEHLSVTSDYFLVNARARIGDAQARASAMLAREERGWPRIVWRKFL